MKIESVLKVLLAGVVFAGVIFGVYNCKLKAVKDVNACTAAGKKLEDCL